MDIVDDETGSLIYKPFEEIDKDYYEKILAINHHLHTAVANIAWEALKNNPKKIVGIPLAPQERLFDFSVCEHKKTGELQMLIKLIEMH